MHTPAARVRQRCVRLAGPARNAVRRRWVVASVTQSSRPSVLITGCSSGIGQCLAEHLSNQGWRVFACVRKEAQLEQVAHGEPVVLDVTKQETVDAARAHVEAAVGGAGLTAIINNAAWAFWSPVECVPLELFNQALDVNVTGTLRVTQAFLPLLRRAPGPRIVNISSVAGTFPLPCWGPYTTSKFALEGLTDCLRMELADQGVKVVLIKPPAIKTPIWSNGRTYTKEACVADHPTMHLYQPLFDQAQKHVERFEESAIDLAPVLDTITTALTTPHPRARYMVTRGAALVVWLRRILPDHVWDWILLNTHYKLKQMC